MEGIDCAGAKAAYVAIELSKGTWMIGAMLPDRDMPCIYRPSGGDTTGLLSRLKKLRPLGADRLVLCFEAGHDEFWLARFLLSRGIDVRVFDPAALQVNRRARRIKTDRIDVQSLLNALVAVNRGERHVGSIVRILRVEEEDARRARRERDRLIQARTAPINRIKGLLFAQGIRDVEPRLRRARIDFGGLRTAEGHPLPPRLRAELEREHARLDMVEAQVRTAEKEPDMADAQDPAVDVQRRRLEQLQGVGEAASSIRAN